MMKKTLAIIFALAMFTLLFVGCGGTDAPAPTDESKTGADVNPDKPFEGVTIEYAGTFNEAEQQAVWVKEMGDLWAEETGGKVDFNFIGRDVLNAIKPSLLTGDAPDIIDQDLTELSAALISGDQIMVESLDDVLDSPAYGETAPMKDSLSGAYELYAVDGSNYFVPYIYITSGFFYNKALFSDLDITAPDTWDEFLTVCQKIDDSGIPALSADGNISFYNCYYLQGAIQRLLGAGAFLEAALDTTGEAWDDPAMLEAATMVSQLSKSGDNYFQEGYAGTAYPAGQNDWAMDGSGMVYCGSWIPLETMSMVEDDFEYGFFPFPSVEGGKGDPTVIEAQLMGFSIPNDAKNKEAAKDFIRFCSSKEAADRLVELSDNMSARVDAIYPDALADVKPIVDGATGYHKNYDGAMAAAPEWFASVFYPADNDLLFGEITPEEFIEQIKAASIKFYANKA